MTGQKERVVTPRPVVWDGTRRRSASHTRRARGALAIVRNAANRIRLEKTAYRDIVDVVDGYPAAAIGREEQVPAAAALVGDLQDRVPRNPLIDGHVPVLSTRRPVVAEHHAFNIL